MGDAMQTFDRVGLREVDRRAVEEFGIPIMVLMENAGRAVAETVRGLVKGGPGGRQGGRVLIVCGPGNNGGDGLVAARWLRNAGVDVHVFLIATHDAFQGPAKTQLEIVEKMKVPMEVVTAARGALRDWLVEGTGGGERDVIVDAIFGTGLSRVVEGVPRDMIEAINASKRRVVSVDIPSGLDCDTGAVLGVAVRATVTVSFCGRKKGFAAAKNDVGEVRVADIGAPHELLRALAQQ